MLFSLSYQNERKKEADEIRCPIEKLGYIYNFIKENPNKRYNIQIESKDFREDQIEIFKELNIDYTISCGDAISLYYCLSKNYNAFLRFPVSDWETFQQLKNLKVSDIYIDGALGFQTAKIANIKGNIKIRISPTISPNASLTEKRSENSFFIRPEDIHLYSPAIDVVDFKEKNLDKELALFSIYKRGSFSYDLAELIKNLEGGFVNNAMLDSISSFAEPRLNCGQICLIPDRSCHKCRNHLLTTKLMEDYLKIENS